jgi:hypothetical protein
MAVDVVRIKLWEYELPVIALTLALELIVFGFVGIAVYGIVRAIGWVIGGFAAS